MSEKMFGLPGKCVACRQKIRIPRLDEVPEGTDTVYLKDHPEFLREVRPSKSRSKSGAKSSSKSRLKSSSRSRPSNPAKMAKGGEGSFEVAKESGGVALAEAPGKDQSAQEEIALGDGEEKISTIPIDVLEPLRNICSVYYRLKKQMKALNKVADDDSANRAEIKGHLARVKAIRADLDEQLRQILMEVAIELSSTEDKIVQTGLSARVGESTFDVYQETTDRLRRRRDRLERRQHNLRGWLATTDPHLAGGYINLSFDSLPEVGFNVTLPPEHDEGQALLHVHMSSVRNALLNRAHAERRLAEMDRMQEGGDGKKRSGFAEARADGKAAARVAEESIAFYRGRLEQLKHDCEIDTETYEAQLDLARGRLQVGEINRGQYDGIESNLLRAKTDAAKARALIRRAINANSVQDVPEARGTFLGRLGAAGRERPIGIDSWIAWGAALFMGVSIFLPAVSQYSPVKWFLEFDQMSGYLRWAFAGPIIYACVVSFAAGIDGAFARGRILAVLWLLATIIGGSAIHQMEFGLDEVSSHFRLESLWFMQPGMFVLFCAHMAILAAAGICLIGIEQERLVFAGTVFAGIVLTAAVFTDFFGTMIPRPAVTVNEFGRLQGGKEERIITVANRGRRTLQLVSASSDARGAYLFRVEQQRGSRSWSPVLLDGAGENASVFFGARRDLRPAYVVSQGDAIDIVSHFEPGNYRVFLRSEALDDQIVTLFTIDHPVEPPEPPPARTQPTPPPVAAEEATPPEPVAPAAIEGVELRLSGILASESVEPKFSFVVIYPDGHEVKVSVAIGDTVHGDWQIAEYNPTLRTVTLSDGGRVLIVRPGERNEIPR